MWLKIKILLGYTILILLSVFIVHLFRQEQMKRNSLRKEEKELIAIRHLTEKSYIGLLDLSSNAEVAVIWEKDDLQDYSLKRQSICDSLQRLKEYVYTSQQKNYIDSLCLLLWNKEILLFKVVETFNELQNVGNIVRERIPTIVSTVQKQDSEKKEGITYTIEPEAANIPKKKWKFWDIFRKKESRSAYLEQKEQQDRRQQSPSKNTSSGNTARMLRSLNEKVTREQAKRQARLLTQMDSLYVNSMELNAKMNNMISVFEKENEERLTARYKEFVIERDRSYYMVASLALSVFLLAIMLYTIVHRDLNRRLRYERELEQSDRRNRELLRSRKELMVSVAHDLRAPLAAIKGCAELLPTESDANRRSGYLDNILHSSDYMLGLVNTLMEYHRIDEGGVHSKDTVFNLKILFEEIADSHRLIARQKNLAFTTSFSGLNAVVCCDSSHIRQISGNLLSNALKFTLHGEVCLEVEYSYGELHISVRDTGVGISSEEKERIFGAFERLDSARNIPGFGLGLAITARLVSEMRGRVEVKSTPGEGSCFSVFLPVPPSKQCACPEEKVFLACELSDSIRVLVMDDNRIQLGIIRKMLSRIQIHCDCCTDVRELTNCLKKQEYALLLTDIQMPGADGFSVLKLLRNSHIPQAREVPVIAVTACSDNKEKYLSAGFSDCLHKPFSEEELLAVVSQIDRPDFTAIMEGEKDIAEMLDIFIEDTTEELSGMRNAFSTKNYVKLRSIIHKAAPLWEMIRINVPRSELKEMASMPPEKWDEVSDEKIKEVIEAVEQAVEKAKKIKEKVYGNRIDSRG